MNQNQSLCIHGHFYQPPREDPFNGIIPDEPGAKPYQNWNSRILDTCYRSNAEMRNFSRISFNMGPTLTRWMDKASPEVMAKIITEDGVNQAIYGAGNAIAQPYNHNILPLATSEDKSTQVRWGIAAFQHHFGRQPEGMWLPETAADLHTLRILDQNGIKFTILAPWQVEVMQGDSPYRIELGSGRSMIAFVYHGRLSSTMSFDTFATSDADAFAEFYIQPEIDHSNPDQLIMIATDGELYGHHQPFRDKFLAHLLDGSVKKIGLKTTWPALWLKQNTVKGKARLIENTSWSCHHGIERWRGECDCTPGSRWKRPLREALDLLNQEITKEYYSIASEFGVDPQLARDEYIHVILGELTFDSWLSTFIRKPLPDNQVHQLSKLFYSLYNCQEMFTSCGWFFDDLSRIEPRNNLTYAAHAAMLMKEVSGKDFHTSILPILREAYDGKNEKTAADFFVLALNRFSQY